MNPTQPIADGMLKPRAILKLVEQEKSGLSDSGLMDSRNVTFSPEVSTKLVEFSPLIRPETGNLDKSVCVGANGESESEEITLESSMENAPEGPLQSSGLADTKFSAADMSTIHPGTLGSLNMICHNFVPIVQNISNNSDDSELILRGTGETDSSEIFGDWAQERSLSFAQNPKLDDSIIKLGDSKLKIAAREDGQKDKSGRKYTLVAYCLPVSVADLKTA